MDVDHLYEAVGGKIACRRLSEAFYARVDNDPLLRPLFPGTTLRCAIEEFSAFLAQFLGGPPEDAERRWWLSLRESHLRFKIGPTEREAWMRNMSQALDDVPFEEPVRSVLLGLFQQSSAYVVNQGPAPPVEIDGAQASAHPLQERIVWRWNAQKLLDEAVAAVRRGDSARAIALAEGPDLRICLDGNRSVYAALLVSMISSGERALLHYVRTQLLADPELAKVRYSGRTLLHGAAASGRLAIVELLLQLGAGPDETDSGGHTPLYSLANGCPTGGGDVVRALVQAGANVDARDGVKHCTPLHMAARRGNVGVARALLDCGANLELRDSLGDTPLRRSVNCNKIEVARLLLARGADPRSRGSKALTPIQAARKPAMKDLLETSLQR